MPRTGSGCARRPTTEKIGTGCALPFTFTVPRLAKLEEGAGFALNRVR